MSASTSILRQYSGLVALPHTVFALPFALASLLLASRAAGERAVVQLGGFTFLLVLLALVFARTAAMAFNRLVDANIDARNPRTANRHIPKGELSKRSVAILVLLSSSLFLATAAALGMHCLVLAPLVLFVLLGYSLTKRFTSSSHLVLGLALALAPGGAWWVIYPEVSALPLLMMATVMLWVAGFDILYSCQDVSFDRANALHSIPAKIGVRNALRLSTVFHLLAFGGFFSVGLLADLSSSYFWGVLLIGIPLIGQHWLVSESDLSRINRAFFTFNGLISIGYFVLVLLVI